MRIAVVDEIANGYIITNLTDGTRHFVDKIDINVLVNTDVDHEVTLKILVTSLREDLRRTNNILLEECPLCQDREAVITALRADFRPPTGWHPTE